MAKVAFRILAIYIGGDWLDSKFHHAWWVGLIATITMVAFAAALYWREIGILSQPVGIVLKGDCK